MYFGTDYLSSEPKSECLVQYTKKGKRSQQAFIMTYEYLHMETIGKDVMLSCHAGGRPRPTVSWTDNDGNAIYNGKKFWVNIIIIQFESTSSELLGKQVLFNQNLNSSLIRVT